MNPEFRALLIREMSVRKVVIRIGLGLMLPTMLLGNVEFVPSFEDKAVPENRVAEIVKVLPQQPVVLPKAKRRVLIYSATAGFRHASIPTGKLALEKMGLSSGAYESVVSDDPANFEREKLKAFDAVILLNTTQDFFMPTVTHRLNYSDEAWESLQARHNRLVDNLFEYVEAGGGLVGIHSASDSCYGHEDYGDMIGGYFNGHPWSARNKVTIVVEDPAHATIKPVFEGMEAFQLVEEIYQYKAAPYSRERLRVLLHLDVERSDSVTGLKREDNDYAVAWVQSVGKGRVFYTNIGHNHHIYSNPLMLKHYLSGIQFATGDLAADTTPSAALSPAAK